MVLFAQPPFSYSLGASNLKEFRYQWVWVKNRPVGFLNANRAPMKTYEDILVFCDRGAPYHPQYQSCAKRIVTQRSSVSSNYGKDTSKFVNSEDHATNVKYPRDVLDFQVELNTVHPTQKPVKLCQYLIKTYTDEGMTVLDNCMGSGTTGVAAIRSGRSFIGIEKNPEYYDIAVRRISETEYQMNSRTTLDQWGGME